VILPPLRPDIETLGAYVQAHLGHRCGRAAPLTWVDFASTPWKFATARFADYAASLCHMRTKATLRRSSRAHLHRVVRSGSAGCVPYGRVGEAEREGASVASGVWWGRRRSEVPKGKRARWRWRVGGRGRSEPLRVPNLKPDAACEKAAPC